MNVLETFWISASFDIFEAHLSSPSQSHVFAESTDQRVQQFTESISFDSRLYA
ncbi:MAG: hypothetical protein ACI9G1_002356, partial [Pirellulaceae bacterium]